MNARELLESVGSNLVGKQVITPLSTNWQNKWLQMDAHHMDIHLMAMQAERWATGWYHNKKDRKKWVVVTGDTGSGKTHCAKRLYRWAREVQGASYESHWKATHMNHIPGIEWFSWMAMASPEMMSGQAFEAALQDVDRAGCVFVDDLGTECDPYKSGLPVQRLCHLLNRLEGKFAWFTTNIKPDAWATKWDRRCEDRLLAADVIVCNSPSFRSEVKI